MRARLTAVNWLDEAIVACLAIGEGALVWLAIAALIRANHADRAVVGPLAIGAGLLLANALPRLAAGLRWHWGIGYLLTALGFLATIAIWTKSAAFPAASWLSGDWLGKVLEGFAIKGEVVWLSVLGAAMIWRRGAGRNATGVDIANEQLRIGAVAAIAILAINSALSGGVRNGAASLAVVVFFAATLIAIALARSSTIVGGVDVGRTTSPSIIALPAAAIVGVGLLAGALISRDLLNGIVWLLSFPVGAIWFVARYLLIALAFVFLILMWPIFKLLERLQPQLADMKITAPATQPQDVTKIVPGSDSGQLPDLLRYGIAALVFLIVCLVVIRIAANRRRPETIGGDETREKLPGSGIGSLWGDLLGMLRGRRAIDDPLVELRGKPEWAHTVAIRDAFGQFLVWTRDRGVVRAPATTAPEHGGAFDATLRQPSEHADLARVVRGYQGIRYRDDPASSEEAAVVIEAWTRMRHDVEETE